MTFKREAPQKLGVILDEVLSQKGYYSICKEYSILYKWPLIVEPRLAAATKCEKIDNGILYVKASSASWRQEAAYLKEKILLKIHKELGCPTIKDIVFY